MNSDGFSAVDYCLMDVCYFQSSPATSGFVPYHRVPLSKIFHLLVPPSSLPRKYSTYLTRMSENLITVVKSSSGLERELQNSVPRSFKKLSVAAQRLFHTKKAALIFVGNFLWKYVGATSVGILGFHGCFVVNLPWLCIMVIYSSRRGTSRPHGIFWLVDTHHATVVCYRAEAASLLAQVQGKHYTCRLLFSFK